jgi:hypothetical protein
MCHKPSAGNRLQPGSSSTPAKRLGDFALAIDSYRSADSIDSSPSNTESLPSPPGRALSSACCSTTIAEPAEKGSSRLRREFSRRLKVAGKFDLAQCDRGRESEFPSWAFKFPNQKPIRVNLAKPFRKKQIHHAPFINRNQCHKRRLRGNHEFPISCHIRQHWHVGEDAQT